MSEKKFTVKTKNGLLMTVYNNIILLNKYNIYIYIESWINLEHQYRCRLSFKVCGMDDHISYGKFVSALCQHHIVNTIENSLQIDDFLISNSNGNFVIQNLGGIESISKSKSEGDDDFEVISDDQSFKGSQCSLNDPVHRLNSILPESEIFNNDIEFYAKLKYIVDNRDVIEKQKRDLQKKEKKEAKEFREKVEHYVEMLFSNEDPLLITFEDYKNENLFKSIEKIVNVYSYKLIKREQCSGSCEATECSSEFLFRIEKIF